MENAWDFWRKTLIKHCNFAFPLNEWFHVCTTWSQSKGKYLMTYNGNRVKSETGLANDSIVPPFGIVTLGEGQMLGNKIRGHYDPLYSHISEVHLWDYALTAKEENDILAQILATFHPPNNLTIRTTMQKCYSRCQRLNTHIFADLRRVYNCSYKDGNVISWNSNTWILNRNAKVSSVDIPCGEGN